MQMQPRMKMQTRNLFLIAVEIERGSREYFLEKAKAHIVKNTQMFESWWNYMPGIFIVVCPGKITLNEINDYLLKFDKSNHYLVIHLEHTTMNGWLPRDAWDWLEKYTAIVRVSHTKNPTLGQLYEHYLFQQAFKEVWTIADIDKLLEPCKADFKPQDIENVRIRLIKDLQNKLAHHNR